MILKDISLNSPQENILYDEVLLQLAEQGEADEVLRFWESNEYFIVLGRIGKEREDIKSDNVNKDNIVIMRRCSGGGTVLQGNGCLNYTLILSKEKDPMIADLRQSYKSILSKVVEALKQNGIHTMFCPISDIALIDSKKKISGNAQKRSKKYILHHGTILYNFDLKKIEHYLNIPIDVPEYRQGRGHLDFVTNINLPAESIKLSIKKIFAVDRKDTRLNVKEQECLNSFLKLKDVRVILSGV